MPLLIFLALIAVAAVVIASFTLHFLFSPWLLLVLIGVLVWIRFRTRRRHDR
jgi:hypothetical protein